MSSSTIHVLIVSFPTQGLINPLLRLAKRLASTGGFLVTFSTTSSAGRKIITANDVIPGHLYPVGDGFLRFDFFDTDCSTSQFDQHKLFYSNLVNGGRKRLPEMLQRLAEEGRPVSCLICSSVVPWVFDVAEGLGIPVATMWAQSCASFLSFYYRYNELVPFPTEEDLYRDVEIPTLPLLKWDELHSFLHPSYPVPYLSKLWIDEFRYLDRSFCVIIDTFDELEHEIIDFTIKLCPSIRAVGPLFRDPIAPNSAALVTADPHKADTSCLDWLDSKPLRSVVYVCFGSLAHIKQEQVDEIAHGIINTGAPFLWVMRPPESSSGSVLRAQALPVEVGPDDAMVVEYSPQERVLAHPSVACFVTHCGWNSTMEALTSGVPMVTFPQWGDQLTNAKFLIEVFGVAVRMGQWEHKEEVIPREEVERCIREATVGPKAEEMRRKAVMWKEKAEKACHEIGSSNGNIQALVEEIRRKSNYKLDRLTSL